MPCPYIFWVGDGTAVSSSSMCAVSLHILGRDTALPSPLYHSGAAGIDILRCVPKSDRPPTNIKLRR